jgi:hydrogenase maturation protease
MFRSHSTHGLGVGEAIELARTLNRMPNSLTVYGIEGGSFRTGVGLSPEVERAAETVFNIILKDIAS